MQPDVVQHQQHTETRLEEVHRATVQEGATSRNLCDSTIQYVCMYYFPIVRFSILFYIYLL